MSGPGVAVRLPGRSPSAAAQQVRLPAGRAQPPRSRAHVCCGRSGRDHLAAARGESALRAGGKSLPGTTAALLSLTAFPEPHVVALLRLRECLEMPRPEGQLAAGRRRPPPQAKSAAPRPRPPAPVLPSAPSLCWAPDPAPPSGCLSAAARQHCRGPSLRGPGPPARRQDGETGHGVLRGEPDPEQG